MGSREGTAGCSLLRKRGTGGLLLALHNTSNLQEPPPCSSPTSRNLH